ncbi:MAG: branched-chain amino acid ABC transporter permease [Pseudomonadota bacterium]
MNEFFLSRVGVLVAIVFAALYISALLYIESETMVGALVIGLAILWLVGNRTGSSGRLSATIRKNTRYTGTLSLIAVITVAAFFYNDHFNLLMLTTVMIFVVACIGLNIQFGYTGLLNFAGAAFFGAGGYTAAVLTSNTAMPHLVVLLCGGIVAVLIGFILILPVLRTRGHYAAVVTIAFSLLFRTLVEVNQVLGGAQGAPVSGLNLFGWDFNKNFEIGGFEVSFYINYFIFASLLLLISIIFSRTLERSWIGLNLDTIRLDEVAAMCFGIDIARWKTTAFAMGNFMLGVVGAFYATMLGFIAPNNFTFGDSLIMVSIILLGGIGSIPGIILAAAIVIILPEKLQAIEEYRFLIFAVGVILILLFRPNGLIRRRMRIFPGVIVKADTSV